MARKLPQSPYFDRQLGSMAVSSMSPELPETANLALSWEAFAFLKLNFDRGLVSQPGILQATEPVELTVCRGHGCGVTGSSSWLRFAEGWRPNDLKCIDCSGVKCNISPN